MKSVTGVVIKVASCALKVKTKTSPVTVRFELMVEKPRAKVHYKDPVQRKHDLDKMGGVTKTGPPYRGFVFSSFSSVVVRRVSASS